MRCCFTAASWCLTCTSVSRIKLCSSTPRNLYWTTVHPRTTVGLSQVNDAGRLVSTIIKVVCWAIELQLSGVEYVMLLHSCIPTRLIPPVYTFIDHNSSAVNKQALASESDVCTAGRVPAPLVGSWLDQMFTLHDCPASSLYWWVLTALRNCM